MIANCFRLAPRWRTPPGVASLLVTVVIATQLATPALVRAQDIGPIPQSPAGLFAPIADDLSASAWLMISGQDPRAALLPDAAAGGWDRGASGAAAHMPSPGPNPAPAPGFSRNLLVTHQVGLAPFSSSPAIAVDPRNPGHIVLAVNDLNLPSPATYVSTDGGASWEGPRQIAYFAADLGAIGDADLAFDRSGALYAATISLGVEPFHLGPLGSAAAVPRISVSVSRDGGLTWNEAASAARANVTTITMVDESGQARGEVRPAFLDSPAIAIGPDPSRPERDIITVAYTEFAIRYATYYAGDIPWLGSPIVESTIRLVRSADLGETWSDPVAISPTVIDRGAGAGAVQAATAPNSGPPQIELPGPAPRDAAAGGAASEHQIVQGPHLAVAADGSLVIAYFDSTPDGVHEGLARVMVARSADGGRTFSAPAQAGVFREIALQPRTLPLRWWSGAFPRIALGAAGEVYIAVTARPADHPADDGDILLVRSLDGGQSWQPPARIGVAESSGLQFFPALAIAPDGMLHAVWSDTRDDPNGLHYAVRHAASGDRGESWTAGDDDVSDGASSALIGFPAGRYLGDRVAIATTSDDLYVAWTDTSLASDTSPNQQVAFARQQPLPAPAATPTTSASKSP